MIPVSPALCSIHYLIFLVSPAAMTRCKWCNNDLAFWKDVNEFYNWFSPPSQLPTAVLLNEFNNPNWSEYNLKNQWNLHSLFSPCMVSRSVIRQCKFFTMQLFPLLPRVFLDQSAHSAWNPRRNVSLSLNTALARECYIANCNIICSKLPHSSHCNYLDIHRTT